MSHPKVDPRQQRPVDSTAVSFDGDEVSQPGVNSAVLTSKSNLRRRAQSCATISGMTDHHHEESTSTRIATEPAIVDLGTGRGNEQVWVVLVADAPYAIATEADDAKAYADGLRALLALGRELPEQDGIKVITGPEELA